MKRIIYVPLEPYEERYTSQLSCVNGWMESHWKKNSIPFIRVEGKNHNRNQIQTGVVLDSIGRGVYALSQVIELLEMIDRKEITDDDVIYFEDFWHPGIEALAYHFHFTESRPKMYAFLWAQSVDKYDFTCEMRDWIRYYEEGNSRILDGIFVASTLLKKEIFRHLQIDERNIHVVGLPYNSQCVQGSVYLKDFFRPKERKVVFSSRFDWEKMPQLFPQICEYVNNRTKVPIKFVMTSSASTFRGNHDGILDYLNHKLETIPSDLFEIKIGLSKLDYYRELISAKIQFNCSLQDWVSWTLLESTTFGCIPVYPYFRSFPEVFASFASTDFLYKTNVDTFAGSLEKESQTIANAGEKILEWIDQPVDCSKLSKIYEAYDSTWERMVKVMNGENYEDLYIHPNAV